MTAQVEKIVALLAIDDSNTIEISNLINEILPYMTTEQRMAIREAVYRAIAMDKIMHSIDDDKNEKFVEITQR